MCKPTNHLKSRGIRRPLSTPSFLWKKLSTVLSLIWPVHPLCLVAIAPILPTWLYLNRGYTVWYHLITFTYLLTNWEPLRRFLMVQGTSISLGWYAALFNDWYQNGRFGHILYMNMPAFMKCEMFDYEAGHVFYTHRSIAYMAVSHVLDTLLHPGIVYFMYKAHRSSGGNIENILSWRVLASTFVVSRLWSMVHTYYHTGIINGWYFGYDVYHIHDLDSWMPAYVAEILFLLILVICKGWNREASNCDVRFSRVEVMG